MFARTLAASSLSVVSILFAASLVAGGCEATGAKEEELSEGDEQEFYVMDAARRAVTEQIWFKGGNGYRRTVPWSSAPEYAADGGFDWGHASAFEPLSEAWWSSGLPSREVTGFEAFTVGRAIHEQIWVINKSNGGRTERYDRTRDVHTQATSAWAFAMSDQGIPCTTADCRVTAWSLVLQGNALLEAAWRGRTAHIRERPVSIDKAAGKYTITGPGDWKVLEANKLPYPAGQANWSNIVGQQGFHLSLVSPFGTDCEGRSIYGTYAQAWSHEDGKGFVRYVPVGGDGKVNWDCAGPTKQVVYSAADMPVRDASLHFLYDDPADVPADTAQGTHRFELRATAYRIHDLIAASSAHHIGLKVVHLVDGAEVWEKHIYNHGLTLNSGHFTVIASKELHLSNPSGDEKELAKLSYMQRCVDYIPNGYCDRNCGNDGYTLPAGFINYQGIADPARADFFTAKSAFAGAADRAPTAGYLGIFGFSGDVPRWGHNSNNDAEAAYQHFLRCNWDDAFAAGEAVYKSVADTVCAEQCDGYAAAPGSTTQTNIARSTMPTCAAAGACAEAGATIDDDTGTRAAPNAARQNPCAGNHRQAQFGNGCIRVDGM